jgi:uncharacterized protein YebE (UPF0316 family)
VWRRQATKGRTAAAHIPRPQFLKSCDKEKDAMDILLWTMIIFAARVADVGLGTIRVQLIIRRKKVLAALTGFVEVLIFILIVSRVIRDIQYWPYVLAYASGFAVGTLLGMVLAEKLAERVMQATVICHGSSVEVEQAVRRAGFALTRYNGEGRDGPVDVFDVICTAPQVAALTRTITTVEPSAFLYTHELSGLQGGYIYGLKSKN